MQQTGIAPSQRLSLGPADSWFAYQLDAAIAYFGLWITTRRYTYGSDGRITNDRIDVLLRDPAAPLPLENTPEQLAAFEQFLAGLG